MRAATLMGLALAGLLRAAIPAAAGPADPRLGAAASQLPAPRAAGETMARPPASQPARAGERRRTYANCNRDSHRRGLQGGARRRFLVRCKLGYEPRHGTPPAAQGQPIAPAKRP